jgi:NitT/TauT family transport system substrate-binding protein
MNRPGRVGRARRGSVRAVGLLAAGMAVLLTAGCGLFGGDSGSDDASSGTTAKPGPLEKSTINVGVMLGVDCSGVQLGILKDLFKKEGLTVKPTTVQSGAVAIPALAGGSLDFTFGNWVSFMKAQASGTADLKFISESYVAPPNSNFSLITSPNSGVKSVQDFKYSGEGDKKKIAVNAVGNINELLIRAVFEANDIKFDDVELKEMAFPDMAGALAAGTVQAAAVVDPFVSAAQKDIGAKIVVDLTGAGPTEDFPVAGFATTAKFAKENPNTVKAFQRVLLEGQQLASDRKNVEWALPKFAKMTPETASLVRLGDYPTTIDPKRLQRVSDLLSSYNMMPGGKKLDVKPLVIPMPTSSN